MQDFAAWNHVRSLGRAWFVRAGVLMWSGAAAGAGGFLDLLYHFTRYEKWGFSGLWIAFLLAAGIASFIIFLRAWANNERMYATRVGA
jgi:Na+-driven multidrug efflux pump